MSTRIVLIGAGSAQFGFDMLGDIFQSAVLEGAHVTLHDINPAALERVRKAGQAYVDTHGLRVTLSATLSRSEALLGADFCVISIEAGDRFALWEEDQNRGCSRSLVKTADRAASSIRFGSCLPSWRSAGISRAFAPMPGFSITAIP